MTITKDQAQILATLACASRPNGATRWDSAGVLAAIKRVSDRSLPEVIMAVIRAASDRDVETPGVIPTPGDHWREQLKPQPFTPQVMSPNDRCSVCSLSEPACRIRWAADHDFQPAAIAVKTAAPPDPERLAAIRATLEPTAGPTERRTLDDMAEANPQLHARVQAVRDANPGLASPPMRATETEPATEGANA